MNTVAALRRSENSVQASVPAHTQPEQRQEADISTQSESAQNTSAQREVDTPRIDTKRLLTVLLVFGVFPLSLLIALDILAGWVPLLTLVGLLIFIPLGSFLVIRTALEEFSRIIEDVAPADPEESEVEAQDPPHELEPDSSASLDRS